MTLEVIKPGLLTTLQDAGRPGHAHLGIGRSGAFDAPALRIANALCGNARDACALEITLLGPTLRCTRATWIAVTGAPITLRINGVDQTMWAPVYVPAGGTLAIGAMPAGCRSYLAVRGGFDVATVLGSRSTDVNAGFGPNRGRPLQAGDRLPVARDAGAASPVSTRQARWRLDPRPWFRNEAPPNLRLLPGTHAGRLTRASRTALYAETFRVEANSNRVGLRLRGPALTLASPLEMVSEGCLPGLLQLPPSGQAIAFGPECPVSGGYPRIGQIAAADLPCLAQLRPGDALRFVPCTRNEALRALQTQDRALKKLEAAIRGRLQPQGPVRST